MNFDIINLDRTKIVDYIKNTQDSTGQDAFRDELIDAVLRIVPDLGHYEEEDAKFSFKIAVGISQTMNDLDGRFHVLQKYRFDDKDTFEIVYSKILAMIKKTAIFCSKDADIFIIQNDENIECGVYFTDLEKTGLSEQSLLEKHFVVFQNIYERKVLIQKKNKNGIIICFDLDYEVKDDEIEFMQEDYSDMVTICRTWTGIFDRVKKTVHGTICLIVKHSWNAFEDNNFTEPINDIKINISRDSLADSDSFQDFENKVSLFISMLNFDGITIIDTDENIRAYNVFCKLSDAPKEVVVGGARHRAYSALKQFGSNPASGYVAIYFQTQEGKIKFCTFNRGQPSEMNVFNPKVMNGGTNISSFKEIEKAFDTLKGYSSISSIEDDTQQNICFEINRLVSNLQNAHNGIDNFFNEPIPAKELSEKLCQAEFLSMINNYCFVRRDVINIVIICITGNSYGYSKAAQDYLWEIIRLFSEDVWRNYFVSREYLDINLMRNLSIKKPFDRWNLIMSELQSKYNSLSSILPLMSRIDDYDDMYRALIFLERQNMIDFEDENGSLKVEYAIQNITYYNP